MKQSTYEKINRAAKWTERYEPNWYLGCAIGTLVTCVFWGTFWGWPFMYFVLAAMAHDRNTAQRQAERATDLALQWQEQSGAWRGLSDAWQKAYFTEPRPQDNP